MYGKGYYAKMTLDRYKGECFIENITYYSNVLPNCSISTKLLCDAKEVEL